MSKSKGNYNKTISQLPVGDMRKAKTDYDIPRFGFKSSIIIMLAATISTIILPAIISSFGVSFNLVAIISNTLITSYAVAYTRCFMESKKGYCKKFWYTYLFFAFLCFVIGFFWISFKLYI